MDTKKIKEQTSEFFDKSKNWVDEKLTKFNDLSLWDKVVVIVVLHYGLRFFKGKSD